MGDRITKARRAALPVAGLLLIALGLAAMASVPPPAMWVGGIQVNEPDHAVWTGSLRRAGMNTVAVTVYAKQGDWDSANLWWEEEEPGVVAEMRAAKRAGLRVVLVLRVALDHAFERNKFFWHGMIQPRDERVLDDWFRRYRAFVRRWARIAQAEGVDLLGVASELNALTNTRRVEEVPRLEEFWTNSEKVAREDARVLRYSDRISPHHLHVRGWDDYESLAGYLEERARRHASWAREVTFAESGQSLAEINRRRTALDAHWRGVIEAARDEYRGPLTYAANFDQYRDVGFWDALDVIGVNAYFPLRERWMPELQGARLDAALEVRWRGLLRSLALLREERGLGELPVVFTEIGYVRRSNNTYRPWAADGFSVLPTVGGDDVFVAWSDQPESERERARALRALYRAHLAESESVLGGVLYWKLSTDPGHTAIEPFVVVLPASAGVGRPDPAITALARFTARFDPLRIKWRLARRLSGP